MSGIFDRTWLRIVRTQPDGVRTHLAAERNVVAALLARSAYQTFIEVGCADGSLLMPTACRWGLYYRGLDLAAGAVTATRLALDDLLGATAGCDVAQVLRADVHDLAELVADGRLAVSSSTLVALPFNVLGNLFPTVVFAATASVGADVVVLAYDTGARARQVRSRYYADCGFQGQMHDDEFGVHFEAGEFTSSVYRRPVVTGWLASYGYSVDVRAYGEIGLAYHGRLGEGPAQGRARSS